MIQPKPRPNTKTARLHEERMFDALKRLQAEDYIEHALKYEAPDAWHTIVFDVDVEEPKEKVTLYLDKSVARLFRAMGAGYQRRINRILATWVAMKLGEYLDLEGRLEKRM